MSENNPACTDAASFPDTNNQEPKTNNPPPSACTPNSLSPSPEKGTGSVFSEAEKADQSLFSSPACTLTPSCVSIENQKLVLSEVEGSKIENSPPPSVPLCPCGSIPNLEEAASHISAALRAADHVPLVIGRFLAETYYDNSRHLFSSRKRKRFSLRALTRLLREQCALSRSFSSLRQMIAAHFQEPELALSADEAGRLTWRARVELLRVHDPAQKAVFARECLDKGLSTRALRARIRGVCTHRTPPPLSRVVLRHAANFLKALNEWEDPVYQAYYPVRDILKQLRKRMERIERLCYCAALERIKERERAEKFAAYQKTLNPGS